jgi:hypothetical protein
MKDNFYIVIEKDDLSGGSKSLSLNNRNNIDSWEYYEKIQESAFTKIKSKKIKRI